MHRLSSSSSGEYRSPVTTCPACHTIRRSGFAACTSANVRPHRQHRVVGSAYASPIGQALGGGLLPSLLLSAREHLADKKRKAEAEKRAFLRTVSPAQWDSIYAEPEIRQHTAIFGSAFHPVVEAAVTKLAMQRFRPKEAGEFTEYLNSLPPEKPKPKMGRTAVEEFGERIRRKRS